MSYSDVVLQDTYYNFVILIPFRPRYSILGHVQGTDLYLDIDTYREVRNFSSFCHVNSRGFILLSILLVI